MITQPFTVVASLILGNPLLDMALAALPDPLRSELREMRAMALSGELTSRPKSVHEGAVENGRIRGASLVQGDVISGSVRAVNLLRGTVRGGTLRAINLLRGDIEGGDLSAINVIAGTIRGGSIKAVNLVLGDIHGGDVTRANIVVGDVYGGRVEVTLLCGDIHGGEVTATRHLGDRIGAATREAEANKAPADGPTDATGDEGQPPPRGDA
ncbi:MAG: hypothetical protein ABI333_30590 [bacterium]